ncbi:MAG: carboxypeptidase-like regulatory domain-containing protein [Acidobacteriota bacterium]
MKVIHTQAQVSHRSSVRGGSHGRFFPVGSDDASRRNSSFHKLLPLFIFILLAASAASAQITRGTLTGRVTDPSGAVIPGAKIAITDTQTGATTYSVSNSAGVYDVPHLISGTYSVTVEAPGFRKYEHTGLILKTEQVLTINVPLEIGVATQSVVVSGNTPLINIANATVGETLTAVEAEDLPSNGRAPLGFAHLEYGAVAKGKHSQSQTTPFDNSVADDFSLGGGNSSSNELLMNGVPNMEDGSRTAGYSPELDSVDAVRVDDFSANAAMGDTAGGFVNITTKGGTNHFHGTASEYYAGSRPLTANPFFQPAGTQQASVHFNQYGATIGGPVLIPHAFNGRNKLFFFYAYEGYIGKEPHTVIESVPTAAERAGDFGALLDISAKNQLFNPFTAVLTPTGEVSRSPIPNNCLVTSSYCTSTATDASGNPLTINPIAQYYLNKMPLPNFSGASTGADGENNFFSSDPTTNNYSSNEGTLDWNITASNKMRFEAHRSNYASTSQQIFNNSLTGFTQDTILWGGQIDDVHTFSPSFTLESRLGFSRYETGSEPTSLGTNPTVTGMPSYIASNSVLYALPQMGFSDASNIQTLSGTPGSTEDFDTIQLYEVLTKVWGNHTFKAGADIRSYKWSTVNPGAADGSYSFRADAESFVTSGPGCETCTTTTPGANQLFGGAFALFELGLPSSGAYNVATKFQYDSWYSAFFAQDDWRVSRNFTFSDGIRIDHETPDVESNNRMWVNFDPTASNFSTSAAEANYAQSPIAEVPVANFLSTGNEIFASGSNRSAYTLPPVYVSPRIGFAYSPGFGHGTLAIRGGFAVYVNPFTDYPSNWGPQYGFSQQTGFVGSTNDNLTPATTLSDPFPTATNPIVQPYGSEYGINTQLGSSVTYLAHVKVPYSEHYELDIQKQLSSTWLVEVTFEGAHQVHNSYNNNVSAAGYLPYLSRSPLLDVGVEDVLFASVANPFYHTMNIGPSTTSALNTSHNLAAISLMNTYPDYTGVSEDSIPAVGNNFNSIMGRVRKNMSHGLQFEFNFIYSRNLGNTVQLNPGGALSYEETSSDFPVNASLTGIYMLPFGRGQRFFHNSKLADELIGGFSISTIYEYLSGTPLQWGNVDYTGNYHDFNNNPHNYLGDTFNTANFYKGSDQPNFANFRTFQQFLLRSDPTNNLDMSLLKNFALGRFVLQPRIDAFNILNHPQFGGANLNPTSSAFSHVTSQLNSSRQLQLGVHILF